ncbi:polysaccharide biosynthesis/export family protein [Sphingomonas sp. C3-2]|uniref:polysaccharide biosynthesis/export family protein n=1 Tax=Sphingomonas sp. C3-2 TaxID=3062169 RepID=UPI00294B877F|nr:polysaccharide biosynthesis/export family protein [Sphingomonas sp. C3-2]WOK36507.1 polysaccharide biosynthesis/export family protein [Sphingomonas sp. C3-2]
MTRFRTALIVLSLALTTGCTSAQGGMSALPTLAAGEYRLGAGDEIRVTVYGLDPMNNSYVVGDAGTISMPLIETIAVDGKTIPEVESAIASAISARQLVARAPSVSAQIQKYRPFFIMGEVQRPGQYPYVPGLTVNSAVSIAGGYTFRANTKAVVIKRKTKTGMVKGQTGPDGQVWPGDTIEVSESWF